MNAVIYRHNPALAALIQKAAPEFVHEFPTEMSIEDIKQGLEDVLKAAGNAIKEYLASNPESKFHLHVDGTVLSAGGERLEKWKPKYIRQDDMKAYDIYADRVAEEAKRVNQSKESLVVIISDRIADHNSEVYDPFHEDVDGVHRMDAEHAAVHNWVDRLRKHEVRILVMAARWFENEVRREGGVRLNSFTRRLRDVVVVCDHHNGMQNLIRECGGTWFNAYPNFSDSDILAS
jgi:hypothetical protein